MKKDIAAIILAAGKGTRMKSNKPKVVFPIAEKPLIVRVVNTAISALCTKIAVVVGYKKKAVMACLPADDRLTYITQAVQNGTGGAVQVCADDFKNFEGNVFILCGDVPLLSHATLTELLAEHIAKNAVCTVLTMILDNPAAYGRMVRNANGDLERIVEYKDATVAERTIKEINSGIYCFDSKELFLALQNIKKNNKQNELYLTDTLEIMAKNGKKVVGKVLDNQYEAAGVNSLVQLAELEDIHYANNNQQHLEAGVQISNPQTVQISEDAEIGKGVYISPCCIIKGTSNLAEGVKLGPHCVLDNVTISANVELGGYNMLTNTKVTINLAPYASEIKA